VTTRTPALAVANVRDPFHLSAPPPNCHRAEPVIQSAIASCAESWSDEMKTAVNGWRSRDALTVHTPPQGAGAPKES
jgi:hypothetical protein